MIIIIFIWIFMAMILSKAFSEGLLSTYFGREIRPMIESIEDVINKKGFKVWIQKRDKDKYRLFMPEQFDKLYASGKVEFFTVNSLMARSWASIENGC